MSTEPATGELCFSLLEELEHGGFAACTRDLGHDGLHVGPAPDSENFQWSDEQAWKHHAVEADEPLWYRALPIGKAVDVETRNGFTYEHVLLSGAVLDDHEQPAALRLDWDDRDTRTVQHVLLPWSLVAALQWGDQ